MHGDKPLKWRVSGLAGGGARQRLTNRGALNKYSLGTIAVGNRVLPAGSPPAARYRENLNNNHTLRAHTGTA